MRGYDDEQDLAAESLQTCAQAGRAARAPHGQSRNMCYAGPTMASHVLSRLAPLIVLAVALSLAVCATASKYCNCITDGSYQQFLSTIKGKDSKWHCSCSYGNSQRRGGHINAPAWKVSGRPESLIGNTCIYFPSCGQLFCWHPPACGICRL